MKLESDKRLQEIDYELESLIVKLAYLRCKRINNLSGNHEYKNSEEYKYLSEEIKEKDLRYKELKENKNALLHQYDITLEGNFKTPSGIVENHRASHSYHTSIDCKIEVANQFFWGDAQYRDLYMEFYERYGFDYEDENFTITDIRQVR